MSETEKPKAVRDLVDQAQQKLDVSNFIEEASDNVLESLFRGTTDTLITDIDVYAKARGLTSASNDAQP